MCVFQYYGHREKLRLIGRENDLRKLNIDALCIAKEVADKTNTLLAGNLSNTTIYNPEDTKSQEQCRQMFKVCGLHSLMVDCQYAL